MEAENSNGNGKPHKWVLDEKNSEPNRGKIVGKPVPGSENLVITSTGKTVDKRKLQNLKRGGSPGRAGKNGLKLLPDLNEALIRVLGEEKDGKTALEKILEAMRLKAIRGSERAADLLLTRAFGAAILHLDEGPTIMPISEPITGFIIKVRLE